MKIHAFSGSLCLLALAACSETTDTAAANSAASNSAATTGAGATADAGAAAGASSNMTAEKMAASMPTDMPSFVAMAASSDMLEIQSSRLAKERGLGGELASFADRMIADHSATSASMKVLLAGMSPPMTPPTDMTGKHRGMMAQLREAGASTSGSAYVDLQRAAHNEAVALYTAYSQRGDNPALRQFAQQMLPALQGHLEHVRRLETQR
jgi:putative membrane protein